MKPPAFQRALKHACALLLLACVAAPTFAASPAAPFPALRIADSTPAPHIDGVLDDAAWSGPQAYDRFFEIEPHDRVPARVRTDIRLAYDKRYLYIAVRAWESEPDSLRAPFARRDKVLGEQDYVGVLLDPTGGGTSAQFIYVNPRGAFSDGIYTDSGGEDFAPDFDVEAASARFDGGWTAEIRIALASLPYSVGQDAPWRLLVLRNRSRDQRYRMLSAEKPLSSTCLLCFAQPLAPMRDLPSGWNWRIMPQLVLRTSREQRGDGPVQRSRAGAASLDVKARPNPNTALDLTLNPDYSQIELDAPQLTGNTNFGLFLPELRPFFLEGADVLQTPFRAISTRTMTAPAWGVRYTRRDAGSDVTLLTVLDDGGGLVQLPDAYFTAYAPQNFRSRATVARGNLRLGALSLGAVATDRTLEDGRGYNRVAGPDFTWQRNDSERLRAQLLFSATTAQPDATGNLRAGPATHGHAANVEWSRDDERWGYQAYVEDVTDGFRSDNGFFSQVGYRDLGGSLTRKLGRTGPLNEFNLYAQVRRETDRAGDVIVAEPRLGVWLRGPLDSTLNLRLLPRTQTRVRRGGRLFDTAQVWGHAEFSPGKLLAGLSLDAQFGDAIDVEAERLGRGGTVSMAALMRPADRFESEASLSTSWVDGRDGALRGVRLYTEQAAQVSAVWHFGPADTLRAIVQRTRLRRDAAAYPAGVVTRGNGALGSLVYRHAAGLGNAVYAGINLARGAGATQAEHSRQNELFVKISWQP
jgi:hypothetical protein